MPFQGFICTLNERQVSPEECLKCSFERHTRGKNHCPFTPPILRGIIENSKLRGLMAYSATELIGCHRRVVLKEQADYWVRPEEAYWAFRGQLAHSIVESHHDGHGEIVEERLYANLDGLLVTGKPDLVYPNEKLVVDYKTTKSVPDTKKRYACEACGAIIRENQWYARNGSTLTCEECGTEYKAEDIDPQIIDPQPYDTHIAQLNVYAWLLAQNDVPVDTAQVVYLDMSEPKPIEVAIGPLDDTEEYLKGRLSKMRDRANGLPGGVRDEPDENWRCDYCEVEKQCKAAEDVKDAEAALQEGRKLLRGTEEDQSLI